MASSPEILQLRTFVGEPDETNYSDILLSDRLDVKTSLNALIAEIWREKAARYAELVTISEGGSTRQNSELYANAMRMAALYQDMDTKATATLTRGTVINRLRR